MHLLCKIEFIIAVYSDPVIGVVFYKHNLIQGMKMTNTSFRTSLGGLLLASACLVSVAHAALIDRGNGMIYDSTQNITWLQNANLAGTRMTWDESVAWASGLTVGGFTDWRLFNADPADTNCSSSFNPGGGFSQQYWSYNCTNNELGHLFYHEFGLTQGQSVATLVDGTNANFNLFSNVQAYPYWSGTEYAPNTNNFAWGFETRGGRQGTAPKRELSYGWAVRDGDVTTVPEPGAFAMFGLGLLGLAIRRRLVRQRK